ncbi:hypothetical protein CC1G_15742 [Coprinopsis cinerea okayama7|uniref:Uncharacterized protein n=1 Tax=Coprinopsis cinerea (strain Okayama-7 / 130 / ATCC MYA-4618 / FGSC 9003) TaxID=240176 RepID=D6RQI9_COPC7|nr:hypothetical protein CC1G_15742 [Coprinopsis cinerea okayama7\|eukprot:XP_002910313.1 hypothetical protein CC1G_15742 [Coprinopsis cinerea okayama7\
MSIAHKMTVSSFLEVKAVASEVVLLGCMALHVGDWDMYYGGRFLVHLLGQWSGSIRASLRIDGRQRSIATREERKQIRVRDRYGSKKRTEDFTLEGEREQCICLWSIKKTIPGREL